MLIPNQLLVEETIWSDELNSSDLNIETHLILQNFYPRLKSVSATFTVYHTSYHTMFETFGSAVFTHNTLFSPLQVATRSYPKVNVNYRLQNWPHNIMQYQVSCAPLYKFTLSYRWSAARVLIASEIVEIFAGIPIFYDYMTKEPGKHIQIWQRTW